MNISFIRFLKQSTENMGLIYVLSQRQLKSRYRKSILGLLWSMINPLITTLVLWFLFVQVFSGRFDLEGSYAVYVYSGILFTNLIQSTIPQIGDSVTATGALAGKVRANPLIFVYSTTFSGVLNFLIGLIPLIILNELTGKGNSPRILLLIPFLIVTTLIVSSLGIIVAQMYSKFHDTQNIVAVGLMLLTYVTPVFYPIEVLKGATKEVISWNPFTILLNSYRFTVMEYGEIDINRILALIIFSSILFLISTFSLYQSWPKMIARL